ncbi:redoxin domain-containing protein [Mycoplasma nasistruthionis]|uniref:Redoxin domain-containing protein n=1 Tax=Mycoplasma nasistruthionis TaxID=353852 RepID=A0A4Y6I6W8_9MOLU|nr:redoxin domain-containing protein [Mycoplasma nasistruthionis]QDF64987.1 redoxin domain-containing protein [Mycoplasma nasistruthionis]
MRVTYIDDKQLTLNGNEVELNQAVKLSGALRGGFAQSEVKREHDYIVVATFPSIDTSVCDMQVLKLAELSEKYPQFDYASFSVDLPTALQNYADGHKVGDIQLYSDYFDHSTLNGFGVLINELKISARAMFVLDKDNKVVYKQINDQVKAQVDFDSLENKMKELI